jgi:hypothetical protein
MTLKNHLFIYVVIISVSMLSGCDSEDPQKEDVPELITKVTLTFVPSSGAPVVATATDPDGEGVQSIKTDGPVTLSKATTYVLMIHLVNGLAQPTDPEYDITKEVEEEGDEHMFFFGWTGDTFSNPSGNGNIDSRGDAVNYTGGDNSKDENGLPLGLTTTWTTTDVVKPGASFHILLKHQPQLKTSTSTADDGETDLDITFQLSVQ